MNAKAPAMSRLTHPLLALCLIIAGACISGSAMAQERTTSGATKNGILQDHIADQINSTVTTFDTEIGTACGSHAVGSEWTEACTGGLTGQNTKVCVSGGIEALKASNCVAPPKDCGGHAHGSSWQASCGNPMLSGTITYQCNDGNISVASMACTANYQCLNGGNYSGSCPAGTSGSVTYTCNNNTLSAVSNTCAVINNPCGSHPHGSTWNTACPSGTTGSITNQCFNGTSGVIAISCVAQKNNCGGHAHGDSWQTTCEGGTYTSQCFDGEVGITGVNCRTIGGSVENIAAGPNNFWGARIAAAIKAGPTCSKPAPTRTGSIASVTDDDAYQAYTTCKLYDLLGGTCTSKNMNKVPGYTAQQKTEFFTYFSTTAWQDYYTIQSTSGCQLGSTQFAAKAVQGSVICKAAGFGSYQGHTYQQYATPGDESLIFANGPQNFQAAVASTYNYYFTSLLCQKTEPLVFNLGL